MQPKKRAKRRHGSERGPPDVKIVSMDGKLLLRIQPKDHHNITFGTVRDGLCRQLQLSPFSMDIYSTSGLKVTETHLVRSHPDVLGCMYGDGASTKLAMVPFIFSPVDLLDGYEPLKMPLERHGKLRTCDGARWEWNRPKRRPVDIIKVGEAAPLTCDYYRLPNSVFRVICTYIASPVTLLDLRCVCRRYREFIDDNLGDLMRPFSPVIENSCCWDPATQSVSVKAPVLICGPTIYIHTARIIRAIQMITHWISPPSTPAAKHRLVQLITVKQKGWTARAVDYWVMEMARARGIYAGMGISTDADVETMRLHRELAVVFPQSQYAVHRTCVKQYYFVVASTGVFEVWRGLEGRLRYTEFNLARAHACLYAMRHRLWELHERPHNCIACREKRQERERRRQQPGPGRPHGGQLTLVDFAALLRLVGGGYQA